MIAIVNLTPHHATDATCDYVVRDNRTVIGRFRHRRQNGLAACLRAAADAVEVREKQAGASELLGLLSRGEAAGPFDGAF